MFGRKSCSYLVLSLLLQSCCTVLLWDLPEQRSMTTFDVVEHEARLHSAPEKNTLFVRIRLDGQAPCVFGLHPSFETSNAFREALLDDSRPRRTLRLEFGPARNESPATLEVAPSSGAPTETFSLRVSFEPSHLPMSDSVPVAVAVTWSGMATMYSGGVTGIAWRVAATPVTVVADIVFAFPFGLIAGYLLLTEPGIFTGG